MTTRWDLVEEVAQRLEDAGIPTPEVDARWIVDAMEERFGPSLASCDAGVMDALVERRAAREPLQLVLGHATFRWVELACRQGVFVPRPETEVVAGLAIEAAKEARSRPVGLAIEAAKEARSRPVGLAIEAAKEARSRPVGLGIEAAREAGPAPRVVEPCTGTGAIALAVASEVPGVRVVAGDRAGAAVSLARENLAALEAGAPPTPWRPGPWPAPGARVEVVRGELLAIAPAEWRGHVDVLVANPPYLPEADTGSWAPEVGDHDPHDALVGGTDGHEVVDALLAAAPTWLCPGGTVVVEIDDRRGDDARAAAQRAGLVDVRVVADLTGRDRCIVGRRATEEPQT